MLRRHEPAGALAGYLVGGQAAFAALLWLPFTLVVTVITFLIDRFGELDSSVWAGATQVPRWYALGVAIWFVTAHVPLFIANGGTRRELMAVFAAFAVGFSGALAALLTLGFTVERLIYRAMGWAQVIEGHALFDDSGQVAAILAEFWLVLLAWVTAVAFVSAAFYRATAWAPAAVLLAIALVGVAESSVGTNVVPVIGDIIGPGAQRAALAAGACLVAAGVSAVAMWAALRDIAVRPQAT